MKKFLSVILTICLVIAVVPMGAFSITAIAETATSGTTGDCTWSLDGTVLTISGNGEMGDYEGTPWGTSITEVIIENGVTSIGDVAFTGCSSLVKITIPDSVTSIGWGAFYNTGYYNNEANWQNDVLYIGNNLIECKTSKTGEYKIKDGTKIIADEAFMGCENLTSVTIPGGVTNIGAWAFVGCSSLESITIPNGVASIGQSAFENCSSLTSITIPNSVTSIGHEAFYYCENLKSITIPDSVTSIGGYAFYNTAYYNNAANWQDDVLYIGNHLIECKNAEKVEYQIKDGTKTIAGAAFSYCGSLTSITIPESVTSIGDEAFYLCSSLTNITIPNSVTNIGYAAFWSCSGITSITISESVANIGDNAFFSCGSLKSITIPNSVTSIGSGAFSYCDGLTSITIPESVTSIGDAVFESCKSLTNITVDKENKNYTSKDGVLFDKNLKTVISYPGGKTNTTYSIPDSVTSISNSAFDSCAGLTSITIPESVTSIGDYAFAYCESLASITIPNGVTSIGDSAFTYCESLTSITIPESVTSIGDYAFDGCTSLTNITIPNSVTSIGHGAFNDCSSLKSITIPNGATSIGDYAFYNCESLTSIIIPNSVTDIGECAFTRCSSLKSITIPDSVTSIGRYAFENTGYYDNAENWQGDVLYIGNHLIICRMIGGTGEYKIRINDGTKTIANNAFNNCDGLTNITIPNGVTSIGEKAFDGCGNLKDVWYTGSKAEKSEISIADYNEYLTTATWHYNTCAGEHTYSGACDATCNLCEWTRKVETAHTYDSENDAFCNVCGHIRPIKEFADVVQDAWYSQAVNYAVGAGIMTGYQSNGLFGTSDSIQRQDFIVMLARYAGADLSAYANAQNKFPDVDNNAYYAAAVKWGSENGIITGYTHNGHFGVGDTITREQLVTMLYRYAKNVLGKDVTVSGDAAANAEEKFGDYSTVSEFSKEAVLWSTDKGVITGKGVNKDAIDPQGNAQRCEVAQIMYNIFKNDIL